VTRWGRWPGGREKREEDRRQRGEPTSIGDLVRSLLRSPLHRHRKALYEEVTPLLREFFGDLAQGLSPLSLRSGTLSLGVNSAAFLHEIQAFRRDELLRFLQARMGSERVRDIRLRHAPS